MDLDKVSLRLLKALYEADLAEDEVSAMIEWKDRSQPNEIISFLFQEKLIKIHTDGTPDGEGGYIDSTVVRTYSIDRRGRAVIEDLKRKKGEKWLDRLFGIIT